MRPMERLGVSFVEHMPMGRVSSPRDTSPTWPDKRVFFQNVVDVSHRDVDLLRVVRPGTTSGSHVHTVPRAAHRRST